MKNNRKQNKAVFLSFIIVMVMSLFFQPLGDFKIYSDEGEESSGNSGGFIIESEKVEGQMDLLGTLFGQVNIQEGIIHGLRITKRLDTGGVEPFYIQITSPGPINVSNLHAETVGGALPEFTGLCLSGENPLWLCLKNVKMTVDEQSASAINLPNAQVTTCYESQCAYIPEESSMSLEDLLDIINGDGDKEEGEPSLEDIISDIISDQEELENIKNLLEQITELIQNGNIDELNKLIEQVRSKLNSTSLTATLTNTIVTLTEQINVEFEKLEKNITNQQELLSNLDTAIKTIETSIKENETKLSELEKQFNNQELKTNIDASSGYEELLKYVNTEQLLQAIETKDMDAKINVNFNQEQVKEDPEKEEDKESISIKEQLETLKEDLNKVKEQYTEKQKEVSSMEEQKNNIEQNIKNIKTSLANVLQKIKEELEDATNKDDNSNDDHSDDSRDIGGILDPIIGGGDSNDGGSNTGGSDSGSNTGDSNSGSNDGSNSGNTNDGSGGDSSNEGNNSDGDTSDEDDGGNIITDLLGWLIGF